MNYLETVNLVFSIIFAIVGFLTFYFIIFFIVGLFSKKKFPKTDIKKKYGFVISARNEANVIGNLIESIKKNNYPQDKLTIFVVAHNCTDNTAEIARKYGAVCYEYSNPNERTKGYALKYLFDQIDKDYGITSFDGFFELDADNILSPDFVDKTNDAFVATKGESVITSFRNSKNFKSNLISGLYGVYFMAGCRLEMRGRTKMGCSTRVSGTGFLFNSKVVKDGWPYVTLTEDWEFTADQIINNTKIEFCDDAVFYDEQPTTFKVMWRQRVRWSRGHLLVCVTRFKDLVKSFWSPKYSHRNKMSLYDIFINCMPICLVTLGIGLAQLICYLFAPLAGISLGFALLQWLKMFGWMMLTFYITCFLQAGVVFIAERKRIKDLSFGRKLALCLVWPLFLLIQYPMDVVALFQKNIGWKVIPHTDTTSIENLHEEIKQTQATVNSTNSESVDKDNSEM